MRNKNIDRSGRPSAEGCDQADATTGCGWVLTWRGRGAALLSGVMLWATFPPIEQPHYAWVALAPLLLAARFAADRREAFKLGLLSGLTFWGLSLVWLWRLIANSGPWPLVAIGHVGLSFYCALYTGLFAVGVQKLWSSPGADRTPGRLARVVFGMPLLWVGTEWLRGVLLSGFAWNFLGVSQYRSLPLIQLAQWGGVYALSALLLMANGALAGLLERMWRRLTRRPAPWQPDLAVVLTLVALSWWAGMRSLQYCRRESQTLPRVRLAAVQPNAPCIFERDRLSIEAVHRELREPTETVAAVNPDLVVWPETALPGALPLDPEALTFVSELSRTLRIPILTGVTEVDRFYGIDPLPLDQIYNSSWLFDADGRVQSRYRKQHLVPFGEFIPLASRFPALDRLSPIGYSCTAGRETVIMHLPLRSAPGSTFAFSPLICFESTVAALSRRAVQAGAQLLINQTNDAWFDGSAEPRQHLAQAVFRAVETRTPMLRGANTGVTAAIDRCGQLTELGAAGRLDGFAGFLVASIALPVEKPQTLYLRHGDWLLGIPAALWLAGVLGYDLRLRRRRR